MTPKEGGPRGPRTEEELRLFRFPRGSAVQTPRAQAHWTGFLALSSDPSSELQRRVQPQRTRSLGPAVRWNDP